MVDRSQRSNDSYRYKAFISYSHTDEKWAKWLHKCLETYRVPKHIVQEHALESNRLIPIFRDRDELASSGDLSATIHRALADSENMIVICSPEAAASHWVNEEIKQFKQMGKEDRVFCLLLGDPAESFPSAALVDVDGDGIATSEESEPLAADVRSGGDGKQSAKLKLIAGMLEVGLDELQQRESQRKQRRLLITTVGALASTAGAIALTLFALLSRQEAIEAAQREALQRAVAEQAREDLETVAEFQAEMLSEIDPEGIGRRLLVDLRQRVEQGLVTDATDPAELASKLTSFDNSIRNLNATDIALRIVDEDILRRATQTLEKEFEDQPVIRGRLRTTIGNTYFKLGLYEQSVRELSSARQELLDNLGVHNALTLGATRDLGIVFVEQGRFTDGEPLLKQALNDQEQLLGIEHTDTLSTSTNLATMYGDQRRFEEAEELFLETIEIQERIYGLDDPGTLTTKSDYAWVLNRSKRSEEAATLGEEVLATMRRILGEEHTDTLTSMNNLAAAYVDLGRYDEAEPLYRIDLEVSQRTLGREHPLTIVSISNLGRFYYTQKRYEVAEPILAEAVRLSREFLPSEFYGTGIALQSYGECLMVLLRYDEAESILLESWAILLPFFGPDHRGVTALAETLTLLYERTGRPDLALEWRTRQDN